MYIGNGDGVCFLNGSQSFLFRVEHFQCERLCVYFQKIFPRFGFNTICRRDIAAGNRPGGKNPLSETSRNILKQVIHFQLVDSLRCLFAKRCPLRLSVLSVSPRGHLFFQCSNTFLQQCNLAFGVRLFFALIFHDFRFCVLHEPLVAQLFKHRL